MNIRLLLSFLILVAMVFVMRSQGHDLITPVSSRGIIDLEFAQTKERFFQLSLFWNPRDVRLNIYLDFLFILAYTFFFVTACKWILSKTGWKKWTQIFSGIAVAAGLFDVCENFLMLMVLNARFDTWVLHVIFYCASIKFIMAAATIIFILISFFVRRKEPTYPH